MVGEVNKIIYNMLVSGKGVFLPSVGTLYIELRGARKISETRLVSPHNVISYSSQEQAPSPKLYQHFLPNVKSRGNGEKNRKLSSPSPTLLNRASRPY